MYTKTFLFIIIILLLPSRIQLATNAIPIEPATFSKNDYIAILVTGFANESRKFGYSGKASMYKATGTSRAGKLTFSAVPNAQNVDCERNSAKDPLNKNDYGPGGYIPPGIYFLHYHRYHITTDQKRHRLGLSDRKCGETIGVRVNGLLVNRTVIQFHVAHNDLSQFLNDVSEGCITFSQDNFDRLFQNSFFDSNSPLNTCIGHTIPSIFSFTGNGNILVFVTDPTNEQVQNNQVSLFNKVIGGEQSANLTEPDFGSSISQNLSNLRMLWRVDVQ
jgi:hypothetical protein